MAETRQDRRERPKPEKPVETRTRVDTEVDEWLSEIDATLEEDRQTTV